MSDVDNSSDSISAVAVKLCPFWDEEPDIWFVHVKQIFTLNLLPAETKPCWLFQYHFLQKLPQELRCELSRLDPLSSYRSSWEPVISTGVT